MARPPVTSRLLVWLAPLALGLLVGAACTAGPTGADNSDEAGAAPGAAGPSAGDAYRDSPHLALENLARIAGYLASDELGGRDEGTPGGELARAFIVEEMRRCGIEPAVDGSYEQPITTGRGVNVLGVVRGSDAALAERTVIVSAHYDHLGDCEGAICNGADDNAAGVAIALAVGCAMAENPPPRSVLVASWDAEEPPTFLTPAMGSSFYAAHPVIPLERTDVAIVLDLVGGDLWPGFDGHFVLGAELSPQVAAAVDRTRVPDGLLALRSGLHLAEGGSLGGSRQPWSDYDAFLGLDKPVLFLTNGQNERYHTVDDEMDALDMPKVAREAIYLAAIVGNLAHAVETPVFEPAGADYALDMAVTRQILEAAVAPGGLVESLGLSAESRAALEADRTRLTAFASSMAAGPPGEKDVARLRGATQRIMCLAGSSYPEAVCSGL